MLLHVVGKEFFGVSLIKALIPFLRAPSSSDHLLKALPPNTVTFRGRTSTWNFGGGRDIRSITSPQMFFRVVCCTNDATSMRRDMRSW